MKTSARKLAISVVCASSLLAGCSSESSDDLLKSAKSYLEKKDDKAAVVQLKNALQKNPDSPEARFLLGRTLLQTGDPVSAGVELRKAQSLKYPEPQLVPVLAKSLLVTNEYRKLTDQFGTTILSERAAAADLKTTVAAAYAAQAETDRARAALRAALESVPDYPPALLFEARMDAAERKFDRALELVDRVISGSPADAEAWHFKGDLLYHVKSDRPSAMAAYRKALSISPVYLPAHVSAIEALLAQRDLPGAKAQVDELRKVLPAHPQTVYFDAQFAFLNNDNKKAGELIEAVLKTSPGNPKALQLAGAIELKNDSLLRAENYLSKALQIAPGLTGARRMLAVSYIRSGQANKALATLEPLLSRDDVSADILSIAAQAKTQTGNVKEAEAYLIRAAKLTPTETKSRVTLALSHAKGGNDDVVLGELEAIAASDSSAYADLVIVNAYIRKNELDKALKAVEAIEKKQPGKPYAANLRGRVQLLRKDTADARRSFERALAIDPVFVPAAASLAALDLADKRPDSAKKRFDSVLAVDPKNMQAMLAVAGLHARAGGSAEEVAALLAAAVKSAPNDVTPRLTLIDHYLGHKDPKRALAIAQEGVAALPLSPELLDALGRAQVVAGERNQAITTFNKLIALQPGSPQGFMRLAGVHLQADQADDARHTLNRALALKPDLLAAQRALIELELKSQRPEEALAIARNVRRQYPTAEVGFVLEGAVEGARKNYSAAAQVYRAGLDQVASPELATRLHATLLSAALQSDAEKFATSWLKAHPKDVRFLTYLGELALSQRNFLAAEGHFRRADQLLPNNAVIMNNLAWAMAQQNKQGAVGYAEKANALFPDKPGLMDTLAAALVAEKQFARAIEIEKKALTLAPDAHGLRLSLAKIYIQAGDKASARVELEKLAKLEGKFAGQPEVSRLLQTL